MGLIPMGRHLRQCIVDTCEVRNPTILILVGILTISLQMRHNRTETRLHLPGQDRPSAG